MRKALFLMCILLDMDSLDTTGFAVVIVVRAVIIYLAPVV